MSPPDRRRAIAIAGGLLLVNLLVFVPGWLARGGHGDFTPFFPDEHPHGLYGWDLRSAWEYVKALGLRRSNPDIFRISVEVELGVIATVLAAKWRRRAFLRAGLIGAYALLVAFLIYHHAIGYFFNRAPVLTDDAPLALNGVHLLMDLASPGRIAIGVLVLALAAAAVVALWWLGRALEDWAATHLHPLRAATLAVFALILAHAGASLWWFGIARDDPVVQLPSKAIAQNLQRSRARAHSKPALHPDPRYAHFLDEPLSTMPDVYVLVMEAYGEVLLTSSLQPATHALLAQMQARLETAGFHGASAVSRAPVYGGGSWMSLATLQTGVRIHRQPLYDEVTRRADDYPHLTRFFDAHGYHTVTVQPGNTHRVGLRRQDLYGFDRYVEGPDLDYDGPQYGWAGVPDQWALGFSRDRVLADAPHPVFFVYMGVSTHAPWADVPPRAPHWDDLATLPRPDAPVNRHLPPDTTAAQQRYFETVAYTWDAFARFIERIDSPDALILVLGDHQPALRDQARSSYHAPVHVLSRNAALIEQFEARGFTAGLEPTPVEEAWLHHESIYPLLADILRSPAPEATGSSG